MKSKTESKLEKNEKEEKENKIIRTFKLFNKLKMKAADDLTMFNMKPDILTLTDIFEKIIIKAAKDFGKNPKLIVSLPV